MSLYSLASLRKAFIDYFEQNQHTVVPSSSLVPSNDPTLMFTNSGMVQFKDVFTGKEKRSYTRATTSQRSLRAGGKHNDLENVGHTARHHTFFEMLGNFSFGDYFKEQAIFYAWELISKQLNLPKDKLCITVYAEDDDTYNLWQKIAGFSSDKIIRIATTDNFWSMGDTGPCGPCSEIFYDHGEHIFGGPPGSKDADGDRFIEVWNLVFMQYEQLADGTRINLPNPSIDTGMGLERIAAIVQGKHDNYDIDLFEHLIAASVELTKNKTILTAHRVIADHIRAVSFLITDGVMPSNEGRGYVLRRILRRAMRYINQLGVQEPVFYKLVKPLICEMGEAYPELIREEVLITHTIHQEEERFLQTLSKGMALLEEANAKSGTVFPGDVAFKLYDTYGFPLDLTADVLKGHNKTIDMDAYETCMEEQRNRSRAAWSGTGDRANEKLWFDLKAEQGTTEFVGYTHTRAQGIVSAVVYENTLVAKGYHGQEIDVIVNQTPFYSESGGQMGDTGTITTDQGTLMRILDTQKKADGVIVHRGILETGNLTPGDAVTLTIDRERRDNLRKNHSATHLLHAALRNFLGTHVTQKGSLVAPDRLRFDFSHTMPVSEPQLKQIEHWVNARIMEARPVSTEILSQEAAQESGAMALFGEKYGDTVRVVTMGDRSISIELCGGTHVSNLGEIGSFKIISESGIASGIRRIEAVVGVEVFNYVETLHKQIEQAEHKNLELYKKSRKEIEYYQKALLTIEAPVSIHGVSVFAKQVEQIDISLLRQKATELIQAYPDALVILLSESAGSDFQEGQRSVREPETGSCQCKVGKVSCVIGVGKNLLPRFDARELAKKASVLLGGTGGGGNPHLAAAGGTSCANWTEFLTACVGK